MGIAEEFETISEKEQYMVFLMQRPAVIEKKGRWPWSKTIKVRTIDSTVEFHATFATRNAARAFIKGQMKHGELWAVLNCVTFTWS